MDLVYEQDVVLLEEGLLVHGLHVNQRGQHVGEAQRILDVHDHAAQLFWAEWLATGFGPEPRGIEFEGLRIGLAGLAPYPMGLPIDPHDYVATFEIDADR